MADERSSERTATSAPLFDCDAMIGRSVILLSCVTATLATNAAGIAFLENNAKNDDVNVVSHACAQ